MTAKPITDTDLDWLAFQYAAGELRGTELDHFEQLLATDERACAALAQTVALGQAVVRCEQAVTRLVRPSRFAGHRPVFRNIAAACGVACLALLIGWWQPWNPADRLTNTAASEVAALWIDGADEDFDDEAAQDVDDLDLDTDDAVPAWLLAAVTHQQANEDEKILND